MRDDRPRDCPARSQAGIVIGALLTSCNIYSGLKIGWSFNMSIVSGSLVAPIPALTLLTGAEFSWPLLCLWVCCVSALGIVVAVVLRHPLFVRKLVGAVLATFAARWVPNWSARFVLVIVAGFVAGESVAAVAAAILSFRGR